MKKYFIVIKNTWDEISTYRFNFIVWRIRTLLQLLTIYLLWTYLLSEHKTLFGYTNDSMVTYILGAQIAYSIVMTTRTQEIAQNIISGDLSFFLIKPLGYFKYWFFRDLGDKAMNIVFVFIELSLIFLVLQPGFFFQSNPVILFAALISLVLAITLNFLLSCLLSMTGFWSPETWAPRFIFYVLLTFFTGGVFPLDILPEPVFKIFMIMPFSYLQYFPVKIYLGQLLFTDILRGFAVTIFWIILFYCSLKLTWYRGLRVYTAAGR